MPNTTESPRRKFSVVFKLEVEILDREAALRYIDETGPYPWPLEPRDLLDEYLISHALLRKVWKGATEDAEGVGYRPVGLQTVVQPNWHTRRALGRYRSQRLVSEVRDSVSRRIAGVRRSMAERIAPKEKLHPSCARNCMLGSVTD